MGFIVIFHVVADVGVAAEELYGRVPLLAADGFIESVVFRGPEGDVTGDYKKINFAVSDCIFEPFFLDGLLDWLNNGIIGVRGEIENEAKGYYSDALVLCRKFLEPRSQRNSFTRLGIKYVKVRSQITSFEVGLRHQILVLRRILLVKLMIPRAYYVDVLLFEDVRSVSTLWI